MLTHAESIVQAMIRDSRKRLDEAWCYAISAGCKLVTIDYYAGTITADGHLCRTWDEMVAAIASMVASGQIAD